MLFIHAHRNNTVFATFQNYSVSPDLFKLWAERFNAKNKMLAKLNLHHLHTHSANEELAPIIIGESNGTPLQSSCLENPMDEGAWWAAVHGVTKSRTGLSDFTFPFHFHALEKEMATHSSVLPWRIPGTEEPGRRPSMGSHRVGHDWSDLAAAAAL